MAAMSLDDKQKKEMQTAKQFAMLGKNVRNRDAQQAVEYLTEAVKMWPISENPKQLAEIYFHRGNCYRKLLETRRALDDYKNAVKHDRQNATYHESSGECHRKQGHFKESVENFNDAIRLRKEEDADKGQSYQNRAMAYMSLDPPLYEKALADFNLASNLVTAKYKTCANRGRCLRKMGRASESIYDLKHAVELEPHRPEGHNNLGLSYLELSKLEEASTSFSAAIALANDKDQGTLKAIYLNNRGLALLHQNKLNQSLEDLDEATLLNAREAGFYFNRANAYLLLNNAPQALSDLSEALSIQPSAAAYYHCKGIAYQELGKKAEAVESLDRALAMNTQFVPALYHLGVMYHADGHHDQAVKMFSMVLSYAPTNRTEYDIGEALGLHEHVGDFVAAIKFQAQYPDTYTYRGQSYLRLREYELAVADLNSAIEIGSQDPKNWNLRALAHRCLARYEMAISDLGKALEKDPKSIDFFFNRSQCYYETAQYKLATQDLHRAIELQAVAHSSPDPLLLYHRGLAQYYLSDSATVRKHCKRAALDLQGAITGGLSRHETPDCYYHIGIASANLQRFEEAVAALTLAIEEAPDQLRYVHERAKCLQMVHKDQEAIADFTRVLRAYPNNAHAYFRRGFSYKALGLFEQAAADLQKAAAIDPENPLLVVNYAQLQHISVIELCKHGQEEH